MRSTSERYKEAAGYGFSLRLEATLDGLQKVLTYDDLLSFKVSGNGSSDESLSFGYVSAFEISFSIINIDGRWDNTSFKDVEWTLKMGKNLSWTESEEVQIGIFKTQESLTADGAINIKATDNMQKFEAKFKGINYPCTLHDLVIQCCKQCNVTFKEFVHPNMELVLDGAYQLTQITCRKVLSLAAEICGCFAIINSFGELEFRWFDTQNIVAEFDIDDTLSFKPGKDEIVAGGTSVIFDGRSHSYGSGNEKISLTEDNRLLMFLSDEHIHTLLENIFNRSEATLIYNEGSFSAIGEPALEIGDVILIRDKNNASYKFLVSSLVLSNNLKMEISSPPIGETDNTVSSSTESGSIPRETSESVASLVSKNNEVHLEPEGFIDDFLVQKFSSESNAEPIAMVTLSGTCIHEGMLTLRFVLDAATYLEFKDYPLSGPYLKTIVLPIQGLISGNHTFTLQLISDSKLEITFMKEEKPTAGSVMIVQGRKLGTPTSWDGLINIGDSFARIKAKSHSTKVPFREALNDFVENDYSGSIFCQTVKVEIVRPKAKLSIKEGSITTTFE